MPGQRASEAERRRQILDAAYQVAQSDGISGLTLRGVAAEADLSHGLVLFHFKRKDKLIGAILDRVLATTAILEIRADIAALPQPAERFQEVLRHEVARLAREPKQMRLFLEYWALGARDPGVRKKVRAALDRYRSAFRELAQEMLKAERGADATVTADALAAVALSFVKGGAAQAMIDPKGFDVVAYVDAGRLLIDRLASRTV